MATSNSSTPVRAAVRYQEGNEGTLRPLEIFARHPGRYGTYLGETLAIHELLNNARRAVTNGSLANDVYRRIAANNLHGPLTNTNPSRACLNFYLNEHHPEIVFERLKQAEEGRFRWGETDGRNAEWWRLPAFPKDRTKPDKIKIHANLYEAYEDALLPDSPTAHLEEPLGALIVLVYLHELAHVIRAAFGSDPTPPRFRGPHREVEHGFNASGRKVRRGESGYWVETQLFGAWVTAWWSSIDQVVIFDRVVRFTWGDQVDAPEISVQDSFWRDTIRCRFANRRITPNLPLAAQASTVRPTGLVSGRVQAGSPLDSPDAELMPPPRVDPDTPSPLPRHSSLPADLSRLTLEDRSTQLPVDLSKLVGGAGTRSHCVSSTV